jgi:hypothetical protein
MGRARCVFVTTTNTDGASNMDKSIKFGVEIETVGISKAALAQAISSVVGGNVTDNGYTWTVTAADGRRWTVVHDGSLTGSYYNGEVVTPVLSYGDLPLLQDVVRALRRAGAQIDGSCGLHIHASHPNLNAPAIARLVKMVAKQEKILEKALGITDRRLGQYCKPIEDRFLSEIEARAPRTMDDLLTAWFGAPAYRPGRYDPSRYRGINLTSLAFRGTVEFRFFSFQNGKLHAGELKAYVQLVFALLSKAMRCKTVSSQRREYSERSAKYDMRVILLRLGMIGDEFETARLMLTKHLPGNSSWKHGRPERQAAAAVDASDDEPTAAAA